MEEKNILKQFKKVLYYARKIKVSLFLFVLCCLVNLVINIVVPILSAKLIVSMTSSIIKELVLTASVILVLELINNVVNEIFNRILSRTIIQEIRVNMQVDLTKETLEIESKEFDKISSGKFIERVASDPNEVSDIFMFYVSHLTAFFTNVGALITIFILSKTMFFYSLLGSIILYLINRKRIKTNYKLNKSLKKYRDVRTGFISEMIRGIRDIKVLNSERFVLDKTVEKINEVSSKEIELMDNNRFYMVAARNIESLFELGYVVLAIYLIKSSMLTVPSALVINNFKYRIETLFDKLVQIMEYNKKFELAANRIFEIIDDKTFKKEKFGKVKKEKLSGKIEFKNVNFSYKKSKVIDDLSFKIKPNEKVAFVGKSGSGKTTIFNLITRLYDNDSGKILLDGIDVRDFDETSLRDNMSMITQNPYIFNFTIKENLLIAKKDATMKEIKEACHLADIDEFIESLEDGYDTKLGENGLILSGGQRQRLAIARALLMKTEIILFDESTSSLDNVSQSKIKSAINSLTGKYTILIIAHRLSTVIDCDRIFVVDKGKIVDSGSHKELLKNCSLYKKLYKNFEK